MALGGTVSILTWQWFLFDKEQAHFGSPDAQQLEAAAGATTKVFSVDAVSKTLKASSFP